MIKKKITLVNSFIIFLDLYEGTLNDTLCFCFKESIVETQIN